MTRIAIIGAPCIDEVISPDGTCMSTQLGGVLYSYAAMQRLISHASLNVEVIPLTFISIADGDLLEPFFAELSSFNFSFAPKTYEAVSNRVKLLYQSDTERSEYCAGILPELRIQHISTELLETLDGIFINMISGFDISLDTLRYIRAHTHAHIHLDIHAMILGELSHHPEIPRRVGGVNAWREWIRNVDSLQMNELEADWFGVPETTSEVELLHEIRSLAKEHQSPKTAIITRAERGATAFDFTNEQIWNKTPTLRRIRNATGSGDVFGAVYTLSRTLGTSEEQSLWQAEEIAGWNAGLPTLEEILSAPLNLIG
ncbi:MAG TPA: PfkB family carbohydrate kinase [Candidatus Kapabacteria bacterium]|nr:PfkB family carbohydrate kinase [Candidatus Kapabacteria bacterium]